MEDPKLAALLGRVLAQGTVIELLLALYLAGQSEAAKDAVFATLRGASQDTGPAQFLSDEAAVFMSDARVHAMATTEELLARTEHMLAKLRPLD